MKTKNILITIVAASTALTSCNNADNVIRTVESPSFTTSVTRMDGTKFEENDEVGIYMLDAGNAAVKDSKRYIVEGGGTTLKATEDGALKYPRKGAVDFRAFYPYAKLENGIYEINLLTNPVDLLYAIAKNKTCEDKSIPLAFDHKLARLSFTVITDDNVEDKEVKLQVRTFVDGTFNVLDGTIKAGTTQEVLEVKDNKVIVVPSEKASLIVSCDGITREVAINHAITSGKSIKIPVNIKGLDLTVSTGLIKVTPWEDESGSNVDVDLNN